MGWVERRRAAIARTLLATNQKINAASSIARDSINRAAHPGIS
jgi:hypothetical protein